MSAVEVLIGVYGWEHRDWCDDFYPEDLPSDWRLDFCANVLRLIVVPTAQLNQAGCEDLLQWSEAEGVFILLESEAPQRTDCEEGALSGFTVLDPAVESPEKESFWKWQSLNSNPGAPSLLALSCFDQVPSPADMRQQIDQMVAAAPAGTTIAWVLDGKAAMVAAEQARLLVEMMGL